jgi:hypothetical protein
MTRVNEYLWQLPHEAEADDPSEVGGLIEAFTQPIMDSVSGSLAARGYNLSVCDVMVKLDERFDDTLDTYYANVRFVKYLQPNIMTRIHFQHTEWALFWPEPETHHYFINLDRFKTLDATMQAVPAWDGRLHTRLSNLPGDALFFEDMDQQWTFSTPNELSQQLSTFLDKFERLVVPWLENLSGVS